MVTYDEANPKHVAFVEAILANRDWAIKRMRRWRPGLDLAEVEDIYEHAVWRKLWPRVEEIDCGPRFKGLLWWAYRNAFRTKSLLSQIRREHHKRYLGEQETIVEPHWVGEDMRRALRSLTERQRDIVVRRVLLGQGWAEIARGRGVVGAVGIKRHYQRGMRRLRAIMEGGEYE